MKKIILLVVILLAIGLVGAFAVGQQEDGVKSSDDGFLRVNHRDFCVQGVQYKGLA